MPVQFRFGLIARVLWMLSASAATTLALAQQPAVVVTPVKYEVAIEDKIDAVRDRLISGLEARNYAVINQLNVQDGLAGRGIKAHPIQLVEFCNLTRAYEVTRHVADFEMFAPCRFALLEKDGKTTVMVQRPAHVQSILSRDPNLSKEGKAALAQFDRDLKDILDELASGAF